MRKTTGAERIRKMRAKTAAELDFDEEKHWLKEQLLIQKLWKEKKEQTKRDEKKIMERREYERVRKSRQRKLKKDAEAKLGHKGGKRLEKYGKQQRWSNDAKKDKLINN